MPVAISGKGLPTLVKLTGILKGAEFQEILEALPLHTSALSTLRQRGITDIPESLLRIALSTSALINSKRHVAGSAFALRLSTLLGTLGNTALMVAAAAAIRRSHGFLDIQLTNDLVRTRSDSTFQDRLSEALALDTILTGTSGEANPNMIVAGTRRSTAERLAACIFLCRDIPGLTDFLSHLYSAPEAIKRPVEDPKSALQEFTQSHFRCLPAYRYLGSSGPDHNTIHSAVVHIAQYSHEGTGSSRRMAEKNAARGLLQQLGSRHRFDAKPSDSRLPVFDLAPVVVAPENLARATEVISCSFTEPRLLQSALLHSSWAHEQRQFPSTLNLVTSSHLNSLGGNVYRLLLLLHLLDEVASDLPATDAPSIAIMAAIKETEIAQDTLSRQLLSLTLFSGGQAAELGQGHISDTLGSMPAKAVLAALWIDRGQSVRSLGTAATRLIAKPISRLDAFSSRGSRVNSDPKSYLQEVCQSAGITLHYEPVATKGPTHAPTFHARVKLSSSKDQASVVGVGRSMREAELNAAKTALVGLAKDACAADGSPQASVVPRDDRWRCERLLLSELIRIATTRGPAGWRFLREMDLLAAPVLSAGLPLQARAALSSILGAMTRLDLLDLLPQFLTAIASLEIEKTDGLKPALARWAQASAIVDNRWDPDGRLVPLQHDPAFLELTTVNSLLDKIAHGTLTRLRSDEVLDRARLIQSARCKLDVERTECPSYCFCVEGVLEECLAFVIRGLDRIGVERCTIKWEAEADYVSVVITWRHAENIPVELSILESPTIQQILNAACPSAGCESERGKLRIRMLRTDEDTLENLTSLNSSMLEMWRAWLGRRLMEQEQLQLVAETINEIKNTLISQDVLLRRSQAEAIGRYSHLAEAELVKVRAAALVEQLRELVGAKHEHPIQDIDWGQISF